ncbi:hypothetical protein MPER_08703 [Moniliophthora perniciosa FA553]|nr:hypothetical protein MPER_08703 [Moniliophthora perniciosa FA553]
MAVIHNFALGIVILLAGVWVVSIQAGGGTADVSDWNSDAELSEEEVSSIPDIRSPSDLEAGREMESPTGAEGRPPQLDWGTASEPLMNPPSALNALTFTDTTFTKATYAGSTLCTTIYISSTQSHGFSQYPIL